MLYTIGMQKWETHCHSKKGSGCGAVSTRKMAKIYAKAGYNGIVLTNHFNISNFEGYFKGRKINWVRRYLKEYYSLKKQAKKYGMTVLIGLEMSLAGDEPRQGKKGYSELLVYGITPKQLDEYGLDLMYRTQEDFYKLCDQNGWICGQSHPFREGTVPLDFRFMHFVEAYNGHTRHKNNNDLADKAAEEYELLKTGGSDFHQPHDYGCGMLFPDEMKIENEKDFVDAVRSGKGRIIYRNDDVTVL